MSKEVEILLMISYILIITLLFVIRYYQKKVFYLQNTNNNYKKIKMEINKELNDGELYDIKEKYELLMKLLNDINSNIERKSNEKIS